jgi:CBS domain containing-hemolysin-like protein
MSNSPTGSEPSTGQRSTLPVVVESHQDQAESLLTRLKRILFGWRTASPRADLELVLTAEAAQSDFSPEEAAMLKNILGLRETRVERIMVPRADIVAVQRDITLGELLKVFEVAGHSRLVVYNDTLDDPTGMVHIRDLIAFMAARAAHPQSAPAPDNSKLRELDFANIDLSVSLASTEIIREMLYAPPSMPALDLLAKMQATRIHLALVIDEYGGSDGLVSIEDLVELIVGDIADEHDEQESPAVMRQGDGSFIANGRASLDDVRAAIGNEFDVGEVADEVDTLGGYLVTRAGHVPVRGELVPAPEPFEAEVLDADPRRVKRVKIYLRKDRRPPSGRDASQAMRAAGRPAASRDDTPRPSPNPPRAP